ncbi:MAG: DUF4446 family protein [Candidatus Paceibacterales bacterium]
MLLPSPSIILILTILALIIGCYCLWQIVSLNRLRKSFFAGSRALDLETVILALQRELQDSRRQEEVLEQALTELKKDVSFAVQKVGLVRFNPFNDGGGNFSFCLAILDAHNSGVVLTSMYGREQNRIYTKKIDDGRCEVQLTEEELEAVRLANDKFQIPNSKQKTKAGWKN